MAPPSKLQAALLLAGVSLCLCAAAQTPSTDAIAAALRDRNFKQALALLHPALQTAPQDPQLWAMQGAAYAGENEKKEALSSFQHALQLAPNYLPALQGAVQIQYDAGSVGAIPLLQRILRSRPNDATSHAMLAVLQYQQGNCASAAPQFEEAGTLLESQPSAQHAYGICLVRLKEFDKAVTVFQRMLALQPNNPQERLLLASVQLMAHQPQDALVTLQPLLQSSGPDAQILDLASSAYEDAGDTEQAVSTLQRAILLDPHNVNLYLEFAYMSAAHQSFQVGINIVNDGIALEPKASPLYFARGVLYVQTGDYKKAESDFEQAYALDPSQSLSAAAHGLAAAQANNLDDALKSVREKLAKKPNDPLLLYVQADILTQKGGDPNTPDFRTAVQSARKAVALQPSLAAAHGVLAKLYLQAGENQQAAEECREVLASNPKDQASVYRLIQALRRTGDTKEIPGLLKRLATLRREEAHEESQRNRYKLVEGDNPQ
jgi:tetratricopeptide (TPR) repeat protein